MYNIKYRGECLLAEIIGRRANLKSITVGP
jgi:hypothetical protein